MQGIETRGKHRRSCESAAQSHSTWKDLMIILVSSHFGIRGPEAQIETDVYQVIQGIKLNLECRYFKPSASKHIPVTTVIFTHIAPQPLTAEAQSEV